MIAYDRALGKRFGRWSVETVYEYCIRERMIENERNTDSSGGGFIVQNEWRALSHGGVFWVEVR